MDDLREKVIKGLECCLNTGSFEECTEKCPYFQKELGVSVCSENLQRDTLALLKTQELPPVKPEKLEEVTTKWLDEMTAKERLKVIALILDDWDGYRTAKGLAGLINEVWAYALYPVKAQEPRVMTLEEIKAWASKPGSQKDAVYIQNFNDPELVWAYLGRFESDSGIGQFDGYGYSWRCWTSRPTDKQREQVKWDQ